MCIEGRLDEVAVRGAQAQAARALELRTILESDPSNEAALTEASALYEAFLHDPYLTKNQGD